MHIILYIQINFDDDLHNNNHVKTLTASATLYD